MSHQMRTRDPRFQETENPPLPMLSPSDRPNRPVGGDMTSTTHPSPRARSGRRRIAVVAIVAVLFSVLVAVDSLTASAALSVRIVNTDGDGVASRNAPSVAARNGYGAPEGATVTTVCWTWGDSVGPYNNRLWWIINYAGRQ